MTRIRSHLNESRMNKKWRESKPWATSPILSRFFLVNQSTFKSVGACFLVKLTHILNLLNLTQWTCYFMLLTKRYTFWVLSICFQFGFTFIIEMAGSKPAWENMNKNVEINMFSLSLSLNFICIRPVMWWEISLRVDLSLGLWRKIR